MKHFLVVLLLSLSLLFIFSCSASKPAVPENDVLVPEIDLVMVKENSDEALKLAQESKLDVEVLNSRLTDINNQLLNFSEEMASVSSAKLEEMENRITIITEEIKRIYNELDTLRKIIKIRTRKKKPQIFDMPTFRPGVSEKEGSLSPQELTYRKAQHYFNKGKFLNAVVNFKSYVKKYPDGSYADNSQYWIGECYYNMKQYARAIANYKKVFVFNNTNKADDAQMRIAVAYSQLGDNDQALVEFKNLLKLYPHSEYENEAKKYIRQLE